MNNWKRMKILMAELIQHHVEDDEEQDLLLLEKVHEAAVRTGDAGLPLLQST